MRRALILTVLATSSMVLLAMLVPLALLVRNYELEDRLARAALGVQATETIVSRHDRGMVSAYLDRVNAQDSGIQTTVLYPDGIGVGPHPGEDEAPSRWAAAATPPPRRPWSGSTSATRRSPRRYTSPGSCWPCSAC